MREYNTQNLVMGGKAHALTVDEQSNGGKASAEARRRNRDLRRALEVLLETGKPIEYFQKLPKKKYLDAVFEPILLLPDREKLYERIEARLIQMLDQMKKNLVGIYYLIIMKIWIVF